jgi:hypothetical protein
VQSWVDVLTLQWNLSLGVVALSVVGEGWQFLTLDLGGQG